MKANRSTDTGPEIALRSALHRRGLRFRKHASPVADVRCRADIVFPTAQVAVFVDGCFWHGCALHSTQPKSNAAFWRQKIGANIARDRRNDDELREAGWTVVRIWEHEDVSDAAQRIDTLVRP